MKDSRLQKKSPFHVFLQEEQVVRVEEQAVREAVWEEECRRQREEARWQLEMMMIIVNINMFSIITIITINIITTMGTLSTEG